MGKQETRSTTLDSRHASVIKFVRRFREADVDSDHFQVRVPYRQRMARRSGEQSNLRMNLYRSMEIDLKKK